MVRSCLQKCQSWSFRAVSPCERRKVFHFTDASILVLQFQLRPCHNFEIAGIGIELNVQCIHGLPTHTTKVQLIPLEQDQSQQTNSKFSIIIAPTLYIIITNNKPQTQDCKCCKLIFCMEYFPWKIVPTWNILHGILYPLGKRGIEYLSKLNETPSQLFNFSTSRGDNSFWSIRISETAPVLDFRLHWRWRWSVSINCPPPYLGIFCRLPGFLALIR